MKSLASDHKCVNCRYAKLAATLCFIYGTEIKNPFKETCSQWMDKTIRYKKK